ncbi:MAG TPA: protein phosphatase 2C domain-containing protein [Bryobacteraceae bacterium]|jgi:serine/threonine protein phosphatase PrpC|nr:protein phosphatase 2C domain-containing protein [Bryobacteraceae bacterium]
MKAATAWQAGVATHPGLERPINEDRVFVDEARGVFAVVDGLGGHAAGELAAETAVEVISRQMASGGEETGELIRQSITAANNRICDLAGGHEAWRGMACVLTMAAVQGDRVTVGHVGDSRLYLAWNGNLRKLTSDHSLVGEMEDHGELTEEEAMLHPRRNEVFRDVGSHPHSPEDPDFIDVREFPLRSDAALLLCSDGLSDAVPSARIRSIVERYDGDAEAVAWQLVEAANEAGGRDNITVVFVPGPEFVGSESLQVRGARARHSATRVRPVRHSRGAFFRDAAWFAAGLLIGAGLWGGYEHFAPRHPSKSGFTPAPVAAPSHITVNATDPFGITRALSIAHPGDTVDVPAGQYLGPIALKTGIDVIGSGEALVRQDPASAVDTAAIVARSVHGVRVKGLRILGDATHPLQTGILIEDSSIEIDDSDISGAAAAGVRILGTSQGELLANFIHGNAGPGVAIEGASTTRLADNRIEQNGLSASAPHDGVEIATTARPSLVNNSVTGNGLKARKEASSMGSHGLR